MPCADDLSQIDACFPHETVMVLQWHRDTVVRLSVPPRMVALISVSAVGGYQIRPGTATLIRTLTPNSNTNPDPSQECGLRLKKGANNAPLARNEPNVRIADGQRTRILEGIRPKTGDETLSSPSKEKQLLPAYEEVAFPMRCFCS